MEFEFVKWCNAEWKQTVARGYSLSSMPWGLEERKNSHVWLKTRIILTLYIFFNCFTMIQPKQLLNFFFSTFPWFLSEESIISIQEDMIIKVGWITVTRSFLVNKILYSFRWWMVKQIVISSEILSISRISHNISQLEKQQKEKMQPIQINIIVN